LKDAVFHHAAQAELDSAAAYYERKGEGLGREFLAEVKAAVARIQQNSLRYPLYKRTRYRFTSVKRFPYVVIYRDFDDYIWIVAVVHGRRRPGYWSSRKPD
jgi:toxin ParE1/3/4